MLKEGELRRKINEDDWYEEGSVFEDRLVDWLNNYVNLDSKREELIEFILYVLNELNDLEDFLYSGILYRGIQFRESESDLVPFEFASYSKELEVARYFAGTSTEYGENRLSNYVSEVYEIEVENAFSLVNFLGYVVEKTKNNRLLNVIEERLWEDEIIYRFDRNIVRLLERTRN